jgi:hypothetical protein
MRVRIVTLRLASMLVVVANAAAVRAQGLPSEPIALADGRVTVGGDVSATAGSPDPGFFNYTDYEHSALRLVRIDVSAAAKVGPHFSLLGEVRSENIDTLQAYALYARIRPWTGRDFDIQVGRIPPTFGAFGRRAYANDNPLIGYPLAYQYLTSLRPDALPASADELLQKRSLGWLVRYSVGAPGVDRGVPLVSAFRWDSGVQVHAGAGMFSAAAAVTAGTVSNPLFSDDNGGRQFAGRLEVRPIPGLIAGTSFARGRFVSDAAVRSALGDGAPSEDFTQTAWGADAEYSHGYYLVRFESIVSAWRIPTIGTPAITEPLRALSTSLEGRYKIVPGLYAAARVEHLGFSDIVGSTSTLPWDAPVTRVEVGTGYSLQRNLLLKISYQHNTRDGGVLQRVENLGAGQLVFWF